MPRWKRSVIYSVSFLMAWLGNIAVDIACGPEPDPYDYYVSFFTNSVQRNDNYRSFYFNGYLFLNNDQEKVSERDINVREWSNYMGKGVKRSDIEHILYDLSGAEDSLYFSARPRAFSAKLKSNSFIKTLTGNTRFNDALAYVRLIKQAEPSITISYDDRWSAKPFDRTRLTRIADNYLKSAGSAKDNFLKLRYLYQAQRALQYAGSYKDATEIYDKQIQNFASNSHVKGWALSLKAGAEWRIGSAAKAAYLFTQVFTRYPERRIMVYNDLNAIRAPVADIIKQTKDKREQAVIHALAGLGNPHVGLKALTDVYRTDPTSDMVSVLLVREINKIEEGYLTPKMNGTNYYGTIGYYSPNAVDSAKLSFVNYIPQLKAFCDNAAAEKRYTEPVLFHLASAYLSWIENSTTEGSQSLAALDSVKLSRRLNDEKQLINLLLLTQGIDKIDSTAEQKLLPSLQWLAGKVKEEKSLERDAEYWGTYDLKYYSASSRDLYAKILAKAYLKQKDTAMAALCILRSEYTIRYSGDGYTPPTLGAALPYFWQTELRSKDINKILGWRADKQASPYFKLLLADIGPKTKNGIYDLLGTAYLREYRYASAAAIFRRLAQQGETTNYQDYIDGYPAPFADQLADYPRPSAAKEAQGYSVLKYAVEMAYLTKQTASKPQNATNYYRLGLGLYNTSFYGNAWIFTAYDRHATDDVKEHRLYYDSDYLQCRRAEQMFLKAREVSKDAEFKARCTYMAAKCRQKQIKQAKWPDYDWRDDKAGDRAREVFKKEQARYEKQITQNYFFKDLKQHYAQTKFYKRAVSECSYLQDFLATN